MQISEKNHHNEDFFIQKLVQDGRLSQKHHIEDFFIQKLVQDGRLSQKLTISQKLSFEILRSL